MSIESYLRAVPKVELHIHLEGAILHAVHVALGTPYDGRDAQTGRQSLAPW